MGIKGLTALLNDEAPDCITSHDIKTFFGRKVAIDASMSLYQFLIAVRQQDGQQLMTDSGETTSHLMGFFYRTLRMIDFGIKPMYVFDGAPPDLKKQVLAGRFGKREEARAEEEAEKDVADAERLDQLARRQVRPTRKHNDEVRELLRLMGIPCITAPSEAEAQCAELARAGKVYAAGSEDMDTLTFGTPKLLKHLTFSEAKKMPVHEVNLEKALAGLKMEMPQFVDLCILMGCDYLDRLMGIGPKVALKLIREHETLENVVAHLRAAEKQAGSPSKKKAAPKKKAAAPVKKVKSEDSDDEDEDGEKPSKAVRVPDSDEDSADEYGAGPSRARGSHDSGDEDDETKPEPEAPKTAPRKKKIPEDDADWPYKEARQLFLNPSVEKADDLQLKWELPDVEGLVKFLCGDFGFSEDRVRKGAERLTKAMKVKQQTRLDGFFTAAPAKRKADDDKKAGGGGGKKAKGTASEAKSKGKK